MPTEQFADSTEPFTQRSLGALLRQTRHEQDISEKEAADRLHITVHYLKAIETDRYEKLPGAIFAKGYVKSYAQLLGLEQEEILGRYEAHQKDRRDSPELTQRRQVSSRLKDRNTPLVMASLSAFVGGFVLLWLFNSMNEQSETSAAAPEGPSRAAPRQPPAANDLRTRETGLELQPTALIPATSEPAAEGRPGGEDAGSDVDSLEDMLVSEDSRLEPPVLMREEQVNPGFASTVSPIEVEFTPNAEPQISTAQTASGRRLIQVQAEGDDVLRISFTGESWVEVTDGTARQIYRDLREAGDILQISGRGPFNVLLGDAPLTRLEFNGDEVDVSDDIRIDNSARLTVGL